MRARDLVGAQDRGAGLGRGKGHALAPRWLRRKVKQTGERVGGLAKRRVLGHVLHQFAIDIDAPAVAQGAQVLRARAQRGRINPDLLSDFG
jgi:hypothetical protein